MPSDAKVSAVVDHLFRRRAGQMVSTLTRILGVSHLDLIEDVVQDALVTALRQWPYRGVPDNPSAWIIQVAKNRALDRFRRDGRWRGNERELRHLLRKALPADEAAFAREVRDDQLSMIFVCCHPSLSRDAQVALTLKSVCGFGVSEIARAFLKPEPTIAQRLVRAKRRLRREGVGFELPEPGELERRIDAVLEVIYLMFNEGYGASSGDDLVRRDLCAEAVRLATLAADHAAIASPKADALAALFLFHAARLETRTDAAGELLLLEDQDRSKWNRTLITQATLLLRRAGRGEVLSTYHLEAEIAACHTLPATYAGTDWKQILRCYDALVEINPSPVVRLNRVVALAEVDGPERALAESERLEDEGELAGYYPAFLIRGELLRRLGRIDAARRRFQEALPLIASRPVARWVEGRLAGLPEPVSTDPT